MRCPIANERSMISSPNSRFCVSCTSKVTQRLVLKSQVLREVCRFPFVMRLHQLASIFRRPLRGPRTTRPSYGLSRPKVRIQRIDQYMNGLDCASQQETA